MADSAENLNYDFSYNIFLAKTMLLNLSNSDDRQKAIRWLRKLSDCNKTIQEMKLRNDFMYYLVLNIQQAELQSPFNENPPTSPLPDIAHLLPGGVAAVNLDEWREHGASGIGKPMLYEKSPDGGAFLAAQPVPRCGAFCYLAVVAREPKKD